MSGSFLIKQSSASQRATRQTEPARRQSESAESDFFRLNNQQQQSLHPEVLRYFRDPQEILGEVIDAMKFQESNKEQLLDHLMDKVLRQRQVLIKVRDEMVHIKAVKSEIQALKEENEKLKRRVKEQTVVANAYHIPQTQPFGHKYQKLEKQDQGIGPPGNTRPMINKPRKNSVQLPIVASVPEKSHSGLPPEKSHVQARARSHASVASSIRGGKASVY
ncbi:hypothetical protein BGZ81_005246 [Podila clonocystis]|nr:hypothetical protein BGZ81_005246 [Podila clonocystis]